MAEVCELVRVGEHSQFELLREIPNPPERLFIQGNIHALARKAIAVVGTRRVTPLGIRAAIRIARDLTQRGFAVVSGLARGVDRYAHEAALKCCESGTTHAVLAHGLDRIYPPEHGRLARDIVERGGCLLSEYPPGTPPLKHHFPQRNRIVAGLTWGTVVVEGGLKSGALITAYAALAANREVFVLPGPFDDPNYAGNHRLIQNGAKLTTSVDEILEELPLFLRGGPATQTPIPEKILAMRGLFEEHQGVASMEEILSWSDAHLGNVLETLEEGRRRGLIQEISPQRFVWCG